MTENTKKPTMLMILDGYGLNPSAHGNAVAAAKTPNLDAIFAKYPNVQLNASGLAVGLPEGQMGNSEVGHLNIGAGRIVYQELTKITKAIDDGIFFGNAALNSACDHVLARGSALHIYGLMSDGGVHSHIDHIQAVLLLAKQRGLENVYIHCFMDGRDVPPTSGIEYIETIEDYMAGLGLGKVGVVSGRYYAMDRDKRWERLVVAYDALTAGAGRKAASGVEAVQAAYDAGETDEFIVPTVCCEDAAIKDGDAVIFCNFRPDRAREITRAFVDPEFDSYGFERKIKPADLKYVCMTQYDAEMPNVEVAFPPRRIENTLGEYISGLGMSQLRIAETEKYAHVTFFFNGGVEAANPGEDRILIPSPKVATYDLQPEMSAPEVTAKVLEEIQSSKYDVIILNFANADMVGHTGVFGAAVKAVETLDICVKQIADAVLAAGGQILLTADHGNADNMFDESGAVVTAHSTNPVPLIHIADKPAQFTEDALAGKGKLADIAPTLLTLMDLAVPAEMDGEILVKQNDVQLYYFSPTGGTKACGEIFCNGISGNISTVNLGAKGAAASPEGDLTVFALPVFGGRIPAVAAEKIRELDGTGKKAVTMAVYGTRAYEDALLELNNTAEAAGFEIIASAAVVAQHSMVPAVGQGRPDQEDVKSISDFAAKVLKKLESSDETPVSVPGNYPYKDAMTVPAVPVCQPECTRCGSCVSACPAGAMRLEEDGVKTHADACILCLACTSACPVKVRTLPAPLQSAMNEKLSSFVSVRRENEYFL